MADLELHNPEFEITVELNGANQTIQVQPDETSDGVEYFICKSKGEQLTQIRRDEDGKWEQLWGDLSQEDIDSIGHKIENKS
ncbi:hypothetical protein [Pedobacter cryoconitis]|uniref:Uncharacterized protein n=1 Tax=Pedobacter cryoconitis TaxID=188932 RepID=A0A327SLF1_9SPHI|nr:hypothetical protein [Pedobacter cryoconitis]RAJ29618.1 hypothetical protein LY11_02882 [Pedobacter cryoconitis]